MKFSIHFDSLTEMQDALTKLGQSDAKPEAVTPAPPKRKRKAKAKEPVADGAEATAEVTPACKETEAKESKPQSKGQPIKCKPFSVPLSDVLWVGVVFAKSSGKACAVGAIKESKKGTFRVGFLTLNDNDEHVVKVSGIWWVGDEHIFTKDEPTAENCEKAHTDSKQLNES